MSKKKKIAKLNKNLKKLRTENKELKVRIQLLQIEVGRKNKPFANDLIDWPVAMKNIYPKKSV